MSIHKPNKNITLTRLHAMKASGEKIACLTAYDASFASILDQAGMDIILVGDSLGMVVQGRDSTVSVTMEDMIYHSQCVSSAAKQAFLIADMPFMSYTNVEQALANATDLIQLGGAQMVKLEASSRQVSIVQELSECGIPICAHLGLRPQYIHKLGGYAMQGKDEASANELYQSAQSLQAAGADMLLLECVPDALAQKITQQSSIPVIGIGAGSQCDGQILVLHDVIGITHGVTPKFAKNFLAEAEDIQSAVVNYVQDVKNLKFPA
ncbi:MAG: 3-methyl-2-oxobutanoate hydroxymethyltransferase [Gammaproteobacteria bacterium]|nr:MAG: 3-methyl-2-oxobutanoate hydroxymethyltransferase [Gammaproteobacteria bacterium]